jgi:hypothetical protein
MNTPTGIDSAAPVMAHHEVDIQAAFDLVWQLHTTSTLGRRRRPTSAQPTPTAPSSPVPHSTLPRGLTALTGPARPSNRRPRAQRRREGGGRSE